MKSRVQSIIKTLETRYSFSKDKPAEFMRSTNGSQVYKLCPLPKESFITYSPFQSKDDFRTAAIDGGSLMIYETPSWSIAYYKLAFRLFEIRLKGKTCNTVQKLKELQHGFVLLVNKEEDGLVTKNAFENGDFLREQESNLALAQIKNGVVEPRDLLLVDGSLEQQSAPVLKAHPNTVGVSKRSFHSINDYSAASYLALKAGDFGLQEKPWFCYPLVQEYPAETVAETIFGTFRKKSTVFRIDFSRAALEKESDKKKYILDRMAKIGVCALDPKYRSYPYPLGAVHTDAVMRKNDKDRAKRFIRKELTRLKIQSPSDVYRMIEKDVFHADWYDAMRKGS